MGHLDRLHSERPEPGRLSVFRQHPQRWPVRQRVLVEAASHQPLGMGRGVDREIEPGEDVGQRTDVILVAVGQNDAVDRAAIIQER